MWLENRALSSLLSFAHGVNDVANAIGPLAAIVHTAQAGEFAAEVTIPLWVMIIGALGISIGLILFGPKLIRMVGEQITKLNPMRAYCVALSAAVTMIIASRLGLPISSTILPSARCLASDFFVNGTPQDRNAADGALTKTGPPSSRPTMARDLTPNGANWCEERILRRLSPHG